MRLKFAVLALALSPFLNAQTPAVAPMDATSKAAPAPMAACTAPTSVLQATYLTDAARLMAGYDTDAAGPLAALSESAAITAHKQNFAAAWKKLDTRQLDLVKAFGAAEVVPKVGTAPLFYPFSGPDLAMLESY